MTLAESDAAERFRGLSGQPPQVFALSNAMHELSAAERSQFDRVFSRPIRFGQLKPYLEASIVHRQTVGSV
jgi:hypothetical protein